MRFLSVLCQLVQATLIGIVGDRLFGPGLVAFVAVNVVLVFVLGESVPKTWAFLNPERAALMTARPIGLVAGCPRCGGWPGAHRHHQRHRPRQGPGPGPFLTEEELLAIAERGSRRA